MKKYLPLILISSISLTSCSLYSDENNAPSGEVQNFVTSQGGTIIYLHEQATSKHTDTFRSITGSGNVIVDFYADWCGPCRNLGNTLSKVASQYPNVTILKVNVDKYPDLAAQYGVRSIPVLVYFKNGQKIDQTVGAKSASELSNIIQSKY